MNKPISLAPPSATDLRQSEQLEEVRECKMASCVFWCALLPRVHRQAIQPTGAMLMHLSTR